jgi:hypothetical protein
MSNENILSRRWYKSRGHWNTFLVEKTLPRASVKQVFSQTGRFLIYCKICFQDGQYWYLKFKLNLRGDNYLEIFRYRASHF